jgi:hypothetical protein
MGNPLTEYGEAIRANVKGDKEKAAEKLAQAVGADKVTTPIATSLDVLLEPPPMLADGLLRLMANESAKRR